jgi:hypothetical protein
MTEQHISDRVEKFFSNAEKDLKPESAIINGFTTPARIELESVHRELGDEDYNKFADIVSKDERIKAHLPGLAIVALSPQTNMFNRHVDRDKSDTVTKNEIEAAAADSTNFDPIHRKALQYAADNFNKLLELNSEDGNIVGNSSKLTTKDIYAAKVNFGEYRDRKLAVKDMRLVLENFDAIDSNGSGKITASEVRKWGGQIENFSKYALPKTTGRMLGGSEELTKPEYAARLAEHERQLKDISTQLGLNKTER